MSESEFPTIPKGHRDACACLPVGVFPQAKASDPDQRFISRLGADFPVEDFHDGCFSKNRDPIGTDRGGDG
jgi:hypothetical protein